jgi:hypothetical protein
MDLDLLNGAELTAVEFVLDFLQLRFDDSLLTLLAWPVIADANGVSIGFGDPGYRDALCFVIGEEVKTALYNEGNELTLEFENGVVIALSLREEELNSPQAGSFTSPEGHFEF